MGTVEESFELTGWRAAVGFGLRVQWTSSDAWRSCSISASPSPGRMTTTRGCSTSRSARRSDPTPNGRDNGSRVGTPTLLGSCASCSRRVATACAARRFGSAHDGRKLRWGLARCARDGRRPGSTGARCSIVTSYTEMTCDRLASTVGGSRVARRSVSAAQLGILFGAS